MDLSPLIDAIDRQEGLLPVDDGELLQAVGPLLERLEDEPRVRTVLTAMRTEARTLNEQLQRLDADAVTRLTCHAEDFEHVLGGASEATEVRGYLARVRGGDLYLPLLHLEPEPGPADNAMRALNEIAEHARAERGRRWTRLIPAFKRLIAAERELTHARRALLARSLSDPAVALARLEVVRDLVNPPPDRYEEAMAGRRYKVPIELEPKVADYVFGMPDERDAAGTTVAPIAQRARDDVRRVLAELHRRLAVGRSRREVVERFRTWAQWYARDDLRELAAQTPADANGRRQVERTLTEQMARWLFEEGLDPLWRPLLGRVEPDLLDPSERGRLFVEAKRSDDGTGVRAVTAQGVRQALDTARSLRATAHQLDEAFVVIFQLDGPLAVVPETIEFTELRIHPVVVDLTAWDKIASSRSKNPIVVTVDDLVTAVEDELAGDTDDRDPA